MPEHYIETRALTGGRLEKRKYFRLAEAILTATTEGGLRPEDIADLAGRESGGGNINCYPGVVGRGCYPLAVFVSLHGQLKAGRKWPYNFEEILQALVQHVQGSCPDTQDVVLITDSWWAPNFEKWQTNINAIFKRGIHIEAYLITYPKSITQINLY